MATDKIPSFDLAKFADDPAFHRMRKVAEKRAEETLRCPDIQTFIALVRQALGFPADVPGVEESGRAWFTTICHAHADAGFSDSWLDHYGDRSVFDVVRDILHTTRLERYYREKVLAGTLTSPWEFLACSSRHIMQIAHLGDVWEAWTREIILLGGKYTAPPLPLKFELEVVEGPDFPSDQFDTAEGMVNAMAQTTYRWKSPTIYYDELTDEGSRLVRRVIDEFLRSYLAQEPGQGELGRLVAAIRQYHADGMGYFTIGTKTFEGRRYLQLKYPGVTEKRKILEAIRYPIRR